MTFHPGEPWLDTSGLPIQAHGGALLKHGDYWYWYGEDKRAHVNAQTTTVTGISCYRSTNLTDWEDRGLCLTAEADPSSPLHSSKIVERPKVLYNAATGRFVLWMHLDEPGYSFSRAGVAVADHPEGPFRLVRVMRSMSYDYGYPESDPRNQKELGNAFLDFNLFQDEDGSAFVVHVSENLMTLYVLQLSDDYTDFRRPAVQGVTWERILVNRMREAPAPFRHGEHYYLFTSGCSGWDPNATLLHRASRLFGPWENLGQPFQGPAAVSSWRTQPTSVFAVPGAPPGSFVLMADRWKPSELRDTRHVWLPFVMHNGSTTLDFRPRWDLSMLQSGRLVQALNAPVLQGGLHFDWSYKVPTGVDLHWSQVPGADGYRVFCGTIALLFTTELSARLPLGLPGAAVDYTVRAESLGQEPSEPSNVLSVVQGLPRTCHLSDFAPLRSFTGFGELLHDQVWNGSELKLAGQEFTKGLWAHLDSEVVYQLGGVYDELSALVGIADSHPEGEGRFTVEADGVTVWQSPVLKGTDAPVTLKLRLSGVHFLRLVAEGPNTIGLGHALWCNLRLQPCR